MDDFLLRALIAGIGIALMAAPLGCVVVWQRMAYFGDTLAHSALLGVALSLVLNIPLLAGIWGVAAVTALALTYFQRTSLLASDTILGILSHTTLAFGLIAISLMERPNADLMGLLFGDILSVTTADIALIYAGLAVVLLVLRCIWKRLLFITLHAELAQAEGIAVGRIKLIYVLLLATVIALSMQLVGILLITALLIVPVAAANGLARSPAQMAFYGSIIGISGVALGLYASLWANIPTGPAIVMVLGIGFVVIQVFQKLSSR